MTPLIRVVDGGGSGFRRGDVRGIEVANFKRIGPVKSVDKLLDFSCGGLLPETKAIVFAMAGEIRDENLVVHSPQIHLLDGVLLGQLTRSKTNVPCFVINDMDGAVMGMSILMPQLRYFMGITWSSGIGVRVFKEGEIICAGEGGHIPLDPSSFAPICACGLRGCAESILGGESVKRRVIAETKTLGIKIPDGIHPCRFLDECFDFKHGWAQKIYGLITEGMATFLAIYHTMLKAPVVVWKGKFATNALVRVGKEILLKRSQKTINPSWDLLFCFSPRPEEDSLIGAAAIFQKCLSQLP